MLKQKAKLWIYGARPKTLFISLSPVMIGNVMAFKTGHFSYSLSLWIILAALFIQIGTNYSNDYFDFLKKSDTALRKGPMKLLEKKLVSLSEMKKAFILSYAIAAIFSLPLVKQGGVVILFVAVFSIIFSLLYTAGPYSLAYLGLADIFVFIFFGPIATMVTYYLQTQTITSDVMIASIAPGLLSITPLILNNIRDYHEDKKSHKKTLIVRFGPIFGKLQYLYIMILSFCVPITLIVFSAKSYFLFFSSLSLLLSWPIFKTLFHYKDEKELSPLLGFSALILIIYSFLFSLFWLL